MITPEQAKEILNLAGAYSSFQVAACEWDVRGSYKSSDRMEHAADETWLKLKTLVESLTAETKHA